MLEIYPVNTEVMVGPLIKCGNVSKRDIKGIITGVFIREARVSYEVSYWDGLSYRQVTLDNFEIDFGSSQKHQIGFRKER